MLEFDVGVSQWQGRRAYQQDSVTAQYLANDRLLAVVCDGMGGTVGGEVAASAALDAIVSRFDPHADDLSAQWLQLAGAANNALAKAIKADEALASMGTTLVSLFIDKQGLRWLSVGDSPLWLFRDGELQRLNIDESYGGFLDREAAAGHISWEEARSNTKRHQLMNVLQGKKSLVVNDIADEAVVLQSNDVLLLASDGIQTLSDGHIAHVMREHLGESANSITEQLMRAVHRENHPKQDNVSIALIKVEQGSESE
ncbi:PP2C family protein-serine/threonine phosphatase [Umboniibacter marinipuniceus]|uniref:Serine/threonine protein phosphatase PrpC n=1 Tax=Umboniibacter marinipuniceus TaxID=569599 RepID=A0A3M0A397_9GAMM|nr:PP2C family serine/threonine-protein phosphatase [Umboniibacter marinipuniceus]RMA78924.1 serine/threonine protein phosphatase PrpC [Umboniibacter marinipuniceus]